MSILKQLLLSVTIVIVAILIGALTFSIGGARQYLDGQLRAQSENAASSLALTLSQDSNQDAATRALLMKALFDTGQFRSIQLQAADGSILFQRSLPAASGGSTPQWFAQWFPLTSPAATREVSEGGTQVGQILVTADDRSAFQTLWRTSVSVFLLVVAAGLLWALFAVLLVRWFRTALRTEITEQVRSIAEPGIATPVRKSRIAELSQATHAIDEVRERVRMTAKEQDARIESLQLELNSDPVTGVANRKYFLNELRRVLQAAESMGTPAGHVLIIRQRDLAAVNAALSRPDADQWLRSVSESIMVLINEFDAPEEFRPQLARLNGSDFAMLMPGFNGEDATRLVQQVRQALTARRVPLAGNRLCRWGLAVTDYARDADVSSVLAQLDLALMRAESAGQGDVEFISYTEGRPVDARGVTGESAWRQILIDALGQNRLELAVEPASYVNDVDGPRYEGSLTLRQHEGADALLSGYIFMPAAIRLGMSAECDLRAVELALAWLNQHIGVLVVRVSLPSLLDPHFLPQLLRRVNNGRAHTGRGQRLVLEIDAHGLVAHPEEVHEFCRELQIGGGRVGLRRFTEQPAALLHLHEAPVHYIKLSGDLVGRLLSSPGAMQLMVAITETAIGLGVKVYADDVQNPDAARLLIEYGAFLPASTQLRETHEEGAFTD